MEKVSPLKSKPLRQAGQSIQEQINEVVDEKLFTYLSVAGFMLFLAAHEWYRWFLDVKTNPVLVTIITIPVFIFLVIRTIPLWKKIKRLKLGRDGEKAVGEYLERLRQEGCIVFHDIVGDKFNLDHVVLSQKGIYVIETKTYSKPKGRKAKVHYDGTHLKIDSIGNKDDVLMQAEAESNWLKETLKESTGKVFKIKPVVVFPGWYVESTNHNKHWVLNPKGLPGFIQSQKEILSNEDVMLAAYHLSRYIRAL